MPNRPAVLSRDRPAHARSAACPPLLLLLVVLLVPLLATLTGVAPASAHAQFLGSDPAEGSQLQSLPPAVVMSYSEEIAPDFVDTAVIAPDGTTVVTTAAVDGTDVTVPLAPADLPGTVTGTWQVVARVVSVDGHPVEHTTSFLVSPPAPPTEPDGPGAGAATDAPAAVGAGPGGATPGAGTASVTDSAVGTPTDQAAAPPADAPDSTQAPAAADDAPTAADAPTVATSGWVSGAVVAALVLAAAGGLLARSRRRPRAD